MCGWKLRGSFLGQSQGGVEVLALSEDTIRTVAEETLVGLSHLKGNPWRVNPFRATSRAQASIPTRSFLADEI